MIIDELYNVPCKILHMQSGSDLSHHIGTLSEHFKKRGSPIMMGGNNDASSKGIVGICTTPSDSYLLVVVSYFYITITRYCSFNSPKIKI